MDRMAWEIGWLPVDLKNNLNFSLQLSWVQKARNEPVIVTTNFH